jgi:hypothetical protein
MPMTMPAHQTNLSLLDAARQWYDAGYAVIPSHEDGGKRPFGAWKQYQQERPTWQMVTEWLNSGRYTGIGVITGKVSGNVEMIELEGPQEQAVLAVHALYEQAEEYAGVDMPQLLRKVLNGCVERSAGGGMHLFVRIADRPVQGNMKLANDADGKVVAETRGEGGFVIVAPTPARTGHDDDAIYMLLNERSPERTVTITYDDLETLHYLVSEALHSHADGINVITPPESQNTPSTPPAAPQGQTGALTPWDDYANRTTWADILTPHGWQAVFTAPDGRTHWTRPGKSPNDGTSATTIEDGPLYVFSTSTSLPAGVGMSKQHVYALLHHGGDHTAATRSLSAQGYGEPVRAIESLPPWVVDEVGNATPNEPIDPTYLARLAERFLDLKVTRDAKQLLAAEAIKGAPPLSGINLADFLAQPDTPERYRIGDLWPLEGRVLLAAAAKSGKTTMVAANLIPALVDGDTFLGQFKPEKVSGTVVMLNMEVGENTLRRWMRDAAIANTDKVVVENLRGKASALSLHTEQGRKRFGTWLADHGAQVVILDPLAPLLASLGLDENANADVATFFAWWSEALALGGVTDDLVVHHTGHAGERSRGASRLLDEPDAIWTLGKEADDDTDSEFASLEPAPRHLSAYGRDVDLRAHLLTFNEATRRMALTDKPRSAVKGDRLSGRILSLMSDGKSRTANAICETLGGNRNSAWKAVQRLADAGDLIQVGKSENGRGSLYIMEATR